MSELLQQTIAMIHPLDEEAMGKVRLRQHQLTKPRGSLGRLEELSVRIAGITGKVMPNTKQKAIVTI
ncbi:MAG: nicotinate-nucleotide--dimethylbenzimidazole phosphoribosyltransferase, partial [Dehalococcoidia bacterium]|nr:nicotinate-nucleotide--dimethylbenzimidazole phosphoribosyltransferase [Dehalococcoidia bacterium]